jgi:hypothetical protein
MELLIYKSERLYVPVRGILVFLYLQRGSMNCFKSSRPGGRLFKDTEVACANGSVNRDYPLTRSGPEAAAAAQSGLEAAAAARSGPEAAAASWPGGVC